MGPPQGAPFRIPKSRVPATWEADNLGSLFLKDMAA